MKGNNAPTFENITAVVAYVISTHGNDALNNPQMMQGFVMDLIRGHEREKRLFSFLCENGFLPRIYEVAAAEAPEERKRIIASLQRLLTDDFFLSSENATEALSMVINAFEPNIIHAEPKKEPVPLATTTSHTSYFVPSNDRVSLDTLASRSKGRKEEWREYCDNLATWCLQNETENWSPGLILDFIEKYELDTKHGISYNDVAYDIWAQEGFAFPVREKDILSVVCKTFNKDYKESLRFTNTAEDWLSLVAMYHVCTQSPATDSQLRTCLRKYSLTKRFGLTFEDMKKRMEEVGALMNS